MSGFEIAGLVLGAFPIAIEALDRYHEAARRFGFWLHIRTEHKKCRTKLHDRRLAFTGNLRRLLLPILDLDDVRVNELIRNPGGPAWKEPETAKVLETRLGDSNEIYLQYIEDFKVAIDELNREVEPKYDPQAPSEARTTSQKLREKKDWQIYRIKFSQGESKRERLFVELKEANERLRDLLQMTEEDDQLVQQRKLRSKATGGDTAICNFWKQASTLFHALSRAWICSCEKQHSTKLQLEHRSTENADFSVVFEGTSASKRNMKSFIISERNNLAVPAHGLLTSSQQSKPKVQQPDHRQAMPVKSAMRSRVTVTLDVDSARKSSATINLSSVEFSAPTDAIPVSAGPDESSLKPITNLCLSLDQTNNCDGNGCFGYLPQNAGYDDQRRYYIYQPTPTNPLLPEFVTLDSVLRGRRIPIPSRRDRINLAFVIASSFLQLLESPWLPSRWNKSDIIFMRAPSYPDHDSRARREGKFVLDQPHLSLRHGHSHHPGEKGGGDVKPPSTTFTEWWRRPDNESERRSQLNEALKLLGILLLELCFGDLLENQSFRKTFGDYDNHKNGNGDGDDDDDDKDNHHNDRDHYNDYEYEIRTALDFHAATKWQMQVEEDSGPLYAGAVGWCLGGMLSTSSLDRWRAEMLAKVVRPLEECRGHLSMTMTATRTNAHLLV